MNYRNRISETFGPDALGDALFYRVPGGLRFELSEGGAALDQVLTAVRKATTILEHFFPPEGTIVVCLRRFMGTSPFSLRHPLRELALAGVTIPKERETWLEPVALDDRWDETIEEWTAFALFEFPISRLQTLLWCAVATDFGPFRPNPHCSIYFLDVEKRLLAHPYDDRGMDVIGPNINLLADAYVRFNSMLLDYDRPTMDHAFKSALRAPAAGYPAG